MECNGFYRNSGNPLTYSAGFVGVGQGPTRTNTFFQANFGTTAATGGTGLSVPQYQLDVAGRIRSAVHQFMDNSTQITATPALDYGTFGQNWVSYTTGLNCQGFAMSANGQYQLETHYATAVIVSNNYGVSWTPVIPNGLLNYIGGAMSASGQYQIIGVLNAESNIYISSTYGLS
jgi:hypothetical protein